MKAIREAISDVNNNKELEKSKITKIKYCIKRKFKQIFTKIKTYPKKNKANLLILDDVFPSENSPFRYAEYMYYLSNIDSCKVVTNMASVSWIDDRKPEGILYDFKKKYPHFSNRVEIRDSIADDSTDLIYVTFYHNLLNFGVGTKVKKNFIFNLYPGGGFVFGNSTVDNNLRSALSTDYCKRVITSQNIIKDYLVKNNICEESKIQVIFGVVIPNCCFTRAFGKKRRYGYDKQTLDICFCAHKYMNKGLDKGYDIFIDVAKCLVKKYKNIHFHVIGEFNESDIEVNDLNNHIHFYGRQSTTWFDNFYLDKDIILSPNRSGVLIPGAFDGFPTGSVIEAGIRGVAMFVTDPLGMNKSQYFSEGKDLVTIDHDVNRIVQKLEYYMLNPSELKSLSQFGRDKIKDLYSFDNQVKARYDILCKELESLTRYIK